MISVWQQSIARAIREQMRSNGSRDTLMSYTDRSMQRCLKSNTPLDRSGSATETEGALWSATAAETTKQHEDEEERFIFCLLLTNIRR